MHGLAVHVRIHSLWIKKLHTVDAIGLSGMLVLLTLLGLLLSLLFKILCLLMPVPLLF